MNNATAHPSSHATPSDDTSGIVDAFLDARRNGRSLPDFPGVIPDDLEAAYAVQDQAIARWADPVVGWKVGYIAAEKRDASGDDRLLGPVFRSRLQQAETATAFEIFDGGFGAIEAEYVLRLDADAPADKTDWTPEDAAALPSTLFIGLEVASSPLATINQLGPRVVVSDFGNNNGLVVGAEIPDWRSHDEAALTAESWIDDARVGSGGATTLPGGLRAAIAFALGRSARRGRPLKAGDLIATGNATGIHDILPGQRARVVFAGFGEIALTARAAGPVEGIAR
ncbi:2-keto-4-pentenoate hydratase [Lysobacteraceae bacterium NML93-0792]|nr:2-keto-4-pentenoate hydratase [Xanthomonadaceae bacterium NML93-0792]PBS14528.1 2-keto-4-pentenoate hydratase [Xanthomonadaceae bacterium NML93-0793]PBS17624.1 2-keto-4-pentenoate hydratase [Xanthomonadaceae bacterium NML93-0831]